MEEGGGALPQNEDVGAGPRPDSAVAPARASRRREWLIKAAVVALVLGAAALLRVYVYESDIVEGSSMQPSLQSGNYLFVCKVAYRRQPPQRFDVITFRAPGPDQAISIKRVVGLPGEWVWVEGRQVMVNGGALVEPYVGRWEGDFKAPVAVPPGHVYVLGDNRDDSEDSRDFGPIPLSSVRGKALFVYFPLSDIARIR